MSNDDVKSWWNDEVAYDETYEVDLILYNIFSLQEMLLEYENLS